MKISNLTKKPINAMATSVLAATMLLTPLTSVLPGQASVVHAAETKKFSDVPDNAWSKDAIYYLVERNVISGMTDGTFAPKDHLTRAQAATIVAKAIGLKVNPAGKPSFNDSKNHWAAQYIAAIENENIVSGRGAGVFDPEGKVTRAEMASMLVKAYNLENQVNGELVTQFEDLKGHWGERYANILVQTGISKGTDKGWAPNKLITRAEAAQFTAKADMAHKEEVKPEVKPEAIEQEFQKLQETYDGFFTDEQHNLIKEVKEISEVEQFLKELKGVQSSVLHAKELNSEHQEYFGEIEVVLNNMEQKIPEIWLERQFQHYKESIDPRFQKLQETYDGFFTDEQHNLAKEVSDSNDLVWFLKERGDLQRMVLSAKKGNSKSQEYFSKMEVVLNNMKPTVEKLFIVRSAPSQKRSFGREFQKLQERYDGFFTDGEKTTPKLPVNVPSVLKFERELLDFRLKVNATRVELAHLGIEVEKGFNLETAEYYAQMEVAVRNMEVMTKQIDIAAAIPNMKKRLELEFKEIQKTYDEFFTDGKKTTLKLPVDSQKFDQFKEKVETLEELVREAKERISDLRIEVKKGYDSEVLEHCNQMEVTLNNMQQTLLKIYDQSGNEEEKPAK